MEIFNDDLDVLEIIEYGFPRRIFVRPNYFHTMDNLTFFKTFRFYKETVLFILSLIEDSLEFPDDRCFWIKCMALLITKRHLVKTLKLHSVTAGLFGSYAPKPSENPSSRKERLADQLRWIGN